MQNKLHKQYKIFFSVSLNKRSNVYIKPHAYTKISLYHQADKHSSLISGGSPHTGVFLFLLATLLCSHHLHAGLQQPKAAYSLRIGVHAGHGQLRDEPHHLRLEEHQLPQGFLVSTSLQEPQLLEHAGQFHHKSCAE